MGSGHILVYAFEVLYEIHKIAGYSEREIPRMILQNNLYGLDIDDRAAQLASFALIMKARHYNRRLFREIEREHLELNLCSIEESNEIPRDVIAYFADENEELKNDVEYLVEVFTDAKEYGSILEVKEVNFKALKERLNEIEALEKDSNSGGITFPIEFPMQINAFEKQYNSIILNEIAKIIKQAEIMSMKYEVCVTNPPYMGRKGMNSTLAIYIDNIYHNSRNDLYSVLIDKNIRLTNRYGFISMITQQSWMFLSSFQKLRAYILDNVTINSMIHLGARAFDEISGEVVQSTSFVMRNSNNVKYNGVYNKLTEFNNTLDKENEFFNFKNRFYSNSNLYKRLPSLSIAYWVSEKIKDIFAKCTKLEEIAEIKQGMATCDNERFLRQWFEINYCECKYDSLDSEDAKKSGKKMVSVSKRRQF